MSKFFLAAITSVLLIGTGCVAISGNQNKAATASSAHVSYNGKGLEVLDVRDWHNQDKGIRVLATLKSSALTEINFQYRFVWYTNDGQPISSVLSTWHTRRVMRGQTVEIEGFSPGSRAADYRLEIIQK
jgi:uncharacterized protein YcfL